MPAFVEISPDPFATSFKNSAVGDPTENNSLPGSSRTKAIGTFDHVRRPVRGIQIKDNTYATIQVRTADGRNIPLIDAGGSRTISTDDSDVTFTDKYSNFLIQSMQESRMEKMQVVQTFGAPFVFFFGEHPRMIGGRGILLNTEDFNWRAEFMENYDRYLRGTKCVENKTRVTLSWDDIVVEGYFVKVDTAETATEPNYVSLEFQMFLTNYQNISRIGLSDFPNASAEIDLNPNDMDTTGEGIGNLQSSTQLVRQLNTQSVGLKNSLLQNIRDGITDTLTIDGKLTSVIDLANQFIASRQVRVPFGFAGGSIFDQDTQIALASVDTTGRLILLQNKLGDVDFKIQALLPDKSRPAFYGRIQDNLDEYIARSQTGLGSPINPPDLFADQLLKTNDVTAKVVQIFTDFGVATSPPPNVNQLIQNNGFGLISVPRTQEEQASGGLSSLRNFTSTAPF